MADSIPIQYAQSLLRLSRIPRDELREDLRELKLPQVLLSDRAVADARLPAEDYGRLFIHLIRKLQVDLHSEPQELQGALQFSAYRMLYLAMAHSRTLEQALLRAAVYFRRFEARGQSFSLSTDNGVTHCRFEFGGEEDSPGLMLPETFDMGQLNWLEGLTGRVLSLSMWHRMCSWFVGTHIDLLAVDLAQGAPDDSSGYTEMFAAPVNFTAPGYGFSFNSRYLAFPVVQGEAAVDKLLETYPSELLKLDSRKVSVSCRVKSLVGSDFSRALPSLQDIADRLFMTTPTLHRRLREEGTSYQQIKDHARRDLALEKLQSGDPTASELAELLGFSDSSTFHRAFKKWTGQTPSEYRKQLVGE